MNTHTTLQKKSMGHSLVLKKKENADVIVFINQLQKIISALYLVTDLLSDNNELKSFMRKSAGRALSGMFTWMRTEDSTKLAFVQNDLYETVSYLSLSYRSQDISDMNYDVLLSEIEKLSVSLENFSFKEKAEFDPIQNSVSLKDFFADSEEVKIKTTSAVLEAKKIPESNPEQVSARKVFVNTHLASQRQVFVEQASSSKETEKQNKVFVPEKLMPELSHVKKPAFKKILKGDAPKASTKQLAKEKRHDAIKSVLVDNKDISIKDICLYIEGCSSKTIQRDLNEMIDQGVVMKKGDRRWSTYSLK